MKRLWLLSVMLLVMLLSACSSEGGAIEEFDETAVNTTGESGSSEVASTAVDNASEEPVGGELEDESADTEETVDEVVYEQAYDFTLTDWQGNEVTLSDYEGKIVFLNFYTTWCDYCDIEMPDFQEAYTKYEGDVVFLLIDYFVQERGDEAYVKSWYAERNYTMPMIIDVEGELVSEYPLRYFPTTYLIDRSGRELGAIEGALDTSQIEYFINYADELTP